MLWFFIHYITLFQLVFASFKQQECKHICSKSVFTDVLSQKCICTTLLPTFCMYGYLVGYGKCSIIQMIQIQFIIQYSYSIIYIMLSYPATGKLSSNSCNAIIHVTCVRVAVFLNITLVVRWLILKVYKQEHGLLYHNKLHFIQMTLQLHYFWWKLGSIWS